MNKNKRILISGLLFLWSIILLLSNLKTHDNESPGFIEPKNKRPEEPVTVFEIKEMQVCPFGIEFQSKKNYKS